MRKCANAAIMVGTGAGVDDGMRAEPGIRLDHGACKYQGALAERDRFVHESPGVNRREPMSECEPCGNLPADGVAPNGEHKRAGCSRVNLVDGPYHGYFCDGLADFAEVIVVKSTNCETGST
jgi:hypothetical protein